ncbi:MAG TPA: DUF4142 domain-containing protein [Stellaceae bacterium]|nr:DUF4142 domain-containing protein [Stellaceae bacterium]
MKALLAAASLCALLAAAPAWAQNGAASAAGTAGLSAQDQAFVKAAGAGNLGEADLGTLAEQEGATPAVREFGRWMATYHGLVAEKWLAAIMADQHQSFHPTLSAQNEQLRRRLATLSGRRFDRGYIDAQVKAHEMTVPKFEKEAREGENPMLQLYARALTPVLEQHLAEAKALAGEGAAVAGAGANATAQSGGSTRR